LDVGGDLYADDLTVRNITGVAATFSGVVSYEDVTNVDSVGIITARSDISIADKIIHTGDTNTAIRFPANDTFTVETAGSEKLRVTSSGSVGIGTDSPKHKLNVYNETAGSAGGILVQNVTYTVNEDRPYLIVGTKDWTGATTNWNTYGFQHRIKSNSGGSPRITIDTFNGEAFCVDNSGNVGINTVSPGSDLHVFGDGQNSVIRIENTGDGNSSGVDFYRERSDGPGRPGGSIFIDSDTASSHAELYIQAQSSSAEVGVTTNLSDNNGVRILLFGGNGTNSRIGFECGTKKLRITADGHFEPDADNSSNLGSASKRFANIYSADLQLSNEGSVNDVDGTWGQYTIQEGENDLFLLNRRNGKTYKFVLQEVD
jgi:hypothetical protein